MSASATPAYATNGSTNARNTRNDTLILAAIAATVATLHIITNGRYDLITPFYASDRLRNLMRLDPEMASRLTVRHFGGGHMFYAWEDSRREFTSAIAAFVADAGRPA